MKKLVVFSIILSLGSLGWAVDKSEVQDRLQKSSNVLQAIIAAPDKGIPEEVLANAKCVAIVPHMVKGGLGFGGQHGRGAATCKTTQGWSAPAFFAITGGGFGV